ncbi:MAG: hypothetical protein V1913_18060 [Fibrobacterota bacterium]
MIKSLLTLCILACAALAPAKGLFLELGPSLGYYLMPDTLRGYNNYATAYYPLMDRSPYSLYSYGNQYRYEEITTPAVRPNWGVGFLAGYPISPLLDIGFEAGWSHSFRFDAVETTYRDSLPGSNGSYPVPYDYYVIQNNVKYRTTLSAYNVGVRLEFTRPLPHDKWSLRFGSGIGSSSVTHEYRVEYPSVTRQYFQTGGNLVYSDSSAGSFTRYYIQYQSVYFRPFVTLSYAFDSTLSFFTGLSAALSYNYEGTDGESDQYSYGYSSYLPDDPFLFGDLRLSVGARMSFPNRKAVPKKEKAVVHEIP